VRIYSEKISGARSDRKQLAKAVGALGKGDVLLITRLDRLARSTRPQWSPRTVRHDHRRWTSPDGISDRPVFGGPFGAASGEVLV
jgi:Resolvase, N terminal domain